MDVKKYKLTLFFGRYETRCAGVWMYSVELFNALCELTQENKEVKNLIFPLQVVFSGLENQVTELERIKLRYAELPIDIVSLKDFKNHRRLGIFRDFFRVYNNTKVLHATANVLPMLGSAKKILTIHDLFQAFPVGGTSSYYGRFRCTVYKFLFYLQFHRANLIVTDLEPICEDLKKNFDNVGNVFSVLPGLKSVYVNSKLPDTENKSSYIVAFGSNDPRKNIKLVIDAFLNTHFLEDITLRVIVSSDKLKEELNYFISLNNIKNIEVLSQVSDNELLEIYQKARAVVFPSFAEGFGFPIYEALSQGLPVVTTLGLTIEQIRTEVRPFVVECDPSSLESLSNAMLRAVSQVQRVEKRKNVAIYIRNVLNFKNTAKKFVEIYKKYL